MLGRCAAARLPGILYRLPTRSARSHCTGPNRAVPAKNLYFIYQRSFKSIFLVNMEREGHLWGTNSLADIAESLTRSVQHLDESESPLSSDFKQNLASSLQELSLRITQLSSGGKAVQDTRHLVQISRQSLQEASLRLKDDHVDNGLNQALKGCLVALRAAEVRSSFFFF